MRSASGTTKYAPMVGVVDVVLVDVVVVVVVVGALLFAPRLYMFRIPDCPGATDAITDPADEDPPELVIQGINTLAPGHGVDVMVSMCPYVAGDGLCATCSVVVVAHAVVVVVVCWFVPGGPIHAAQSASE